jgi:hypothetical protein
MESVSREGVAQRADWRYIRDGMAGRTQTSESSPGKVTARSQEERVKQTSILEVD